MRTSNLGVTANVLCIIFCTLHSFKLPSLLRPLSDPVDIARHNRMISIVDQMLSLNKQLKEARTPHEKTALQRQMKLPQPDRYPGLRALWAD